MKHPVSSSFRRTSYVQFSYFDFEYDTAVFSGTFVNFKVLECTISY